MNMDFRSLTATARNSVLPIFKKEVLIRKAVTTRITKTRDVEAVPG